jgi:serine/threonine protein kinase
VQKNGLGVTSCVKTLCHIQVYKARWNGNKTLNSSTQEAEDALQREATILGKLRHPHITSYPGLFRDADNKVRILTLPFCSSLPLLSILGLEVLRCVRRILA